MYGTNSTHNFITLEKNEPIYQLNLSTQTYYFHIVHNTIHNTIKMTHTW